jgi:mannose-1-phosphate guanylyltransferase
LASAKRFWVITNSDLQGIIKKQLPRLSAKQVLAEPAGRNTAPAIGLAAFLIARKDPDGVLGLFPSDHVIADEKRLREDLQHAIRIAGAGENIVVMGVRPTRAETGYGYIETGTHVNGDLRVRRFREKPDAATAQQFLESGHFLWNSGMFVWSARTLVNAMREHLPKTAALLEEIAAAYGTARFAAKFKKLYPKCENISVDYAVLEPRSAKGEQSSNLFCIPSDFGWNDLGSWTALYEHNAGSSSTANVLRGAGSFALDAIGNYVHAPGKFIATVGVKDLVVVETDDALLITTRQQAQDVGKVVKYLDEKKLKKLL